MSIRRSGKSWLVLVYQFPQGAGARRVKVWRRLQSIGAIAIKNSVYVLPRSEQSQEDFEWLLAELIESGAEAALLESQFINGMDDQQLRDLFKAARDSDYAELVEEIETAIHALGEPSASGGGEVHTVRQSLSRARRRMADIEAIDFFVAEGRDAAQAGLRSLEQHLATREVPAVEGGKEMEESVSTELKNRVWVTRRNVRVDRIASAWLIRRWIDPGARFKFVGGQDYAPGEGEVRFDMFDAEFTHEGDRCTFEVLARLAAPDDAALACVGEIVHDIDLKDGKFGRPETQGVASLLSGLVAALDEDERRIERGAALFEDLYTHFRDASN